MVTKDEAVARITAPGARFETREELVLGHPLPVFVNRHRSLGELLTESAAFGDAEYLVAGDLRLSYTDHLARVAAVAEGLRTEHGIGPGDRVAIGAANSIDWIVAFWATVSLGAVVVGTNAHWAGPEFTDAVRLTTPSLMLTDAKVRSRLEPLEVPVLDLAETVQGLAARHAGAELVLAEVDEDDPAVILFTSGTSGRPKGATASHRNIVAAAWFHMYNDAVAAEMGSPQTNRRFLLSTPLFHIAALHNLSVVRLAVGDTAVLYTGRFDVERVLELVAGERITNWGAVPTMLHRLSTADLGRYDLSSLRSVSINSAPSSRELREKIRELVPTLPGGLGTSYGLTETSTASTVAGPFDLHTRPETVGRAAVNTSVQIRDEHGQPVPDGVEGEIHVKGATVMLGYWDNAKANEEAFDDERWFCTGDLGTMEDGWLTMSSRRSDLIIRGGENVYPTEVENVLVQHDAVSEVAVLGEPDDEYGQQVVAVVVPEQGAAFDEASVRAFAASHLAAYKVPGRVELRAEPLPRNALGKVMRHRIELAPSADATRA